MKVTLVLLALVAAAYCASLEERFILDSFGLDVKDVERQLLQALGSDTTEAACETACPGILSTIPGGVLATPLCSLACKSLQSAVGK